MSQFDMKWIDEYLEEEPEVIFDIGSYDGTDSIRFIKECEKAIVYAFEPSPVNFKNMRTDKYDRIKKVNCAVSDTVGNGVFYELTNSPIYIGSGSILKPNREKYIHDYKLEERKDISIITIEKFCMEESIELLGTTI